MKNNKIGFIGLCLSVFFAVTLLLSTNLLYVDICYDVNATEELDKQLENESMTEELVDVQSEINSLDEKRLDIGVFLFFILMCDSIIGVVGLVLSFIGMFREPKKPAYLGLIVIGAAVLLCFAELFAMLYFNTPVKTYFSN